MGIFIFVNFQSLAPLFCADDEFRCVNGEKCIWQGLRCDLFPDCADQSDEQNCRKLFSKNYSINVDLASPLAPTIKDCPSPNLFCGQTCVSPEKVCDGRYIFFILKNIKKVIHNLYLNLKTYFFQERLCQGRG
jgi:hypothetical protein